jgi:hypothetical protein
VTEEVVISVNQTTDIFYPAMGQRGQSMGLLSWETMPPNEIQPFIDAGGFRLTATVQVEGDEAPTELAYDFVIEKRGFFFTR